MAAALNIEAARAEYAGDWDENGTTAAYIPREVAHRFLVNHGWAMKLDGKRMGPCGWIHVDGTECWETDEAVQLTIAALAQ